MLALSWQRIRSPREKRPYPSREFVPQGKNVGLIIAENLFPQGKNGLIPADNFFPREKNVGLIPAENSFPHGKMLFLADNLFPQGKNVFIPVENISPGGFFVVALIPVEKVFPMGKPGWFPPPPPPPPQDDCFEAMLLILQMKFCQNSGFIFAVESLIWRTHILQFHFKD